MLYSYYTKYSPTWLYIASYSYTVKSRVRPQRKISCATAQIAPTLTISFPRWRHMSLTSCPGPIIGSDSLPTCIVFPLCHIYNLLFFADVFMVSSQIDVETWRMRSRAELLLISQDDGSEDEEESEEVQIDFLLNNTKFNSIMYLHIKMKHVLYNII